MPSLLGLRWERYDPTTSRPSQGWANDDPGDEPELVFDEDENSNGEGRTSDDMADVNIEEVIDDEIGRLNDQYARRIRWSGVTEEIPRESDEPEELLDADVDTAPELTEVAENVVEDGSAGPNEQTDEEDFDDDVLFALTPETCPGSSSSQRPLPLKTKLRVFVGTWNMAAEDPFAVRRRGQYIGDDLAAQALRDFLPLGYDIYVLGTQEKVTKHLHAAVLARLQQANSESQSQTYQRLQLTPKRQVVSPRGDRQASELGTSWGLSSIYSDSPRSPNGDQDHHEEDPRFTSYAVLEPSDEAPESWWSRLREHEEIKGHGDHALIRRKSTGLSVYYASHLQGRVEVVATGSHKFTGSKGGIAVTLRFAGDPQTLTFVNCHLEANRLERRRRQLEKLNRELPRALSKRDNQTESSLATCSDHVVWMGDFNYRIQALDGDDVLYLLSAGRLQELHDQYDSMAEDLENVPGLLAFREPVKWPTFYPTYKKNASRSRLPLSGSTTSAGRNTRWAEHVYQTNYREPFYKGGRLRQRVPGWCDRILYCSRPQTPWQDCLQVEQVTCSDASRGVSSFSHDAVRDNYRSLNDELRGSDHSPVSCTFLWSVQA